DEEIEIQLEPECYLFKVLPGNEITFEGNSVITEFKWALTTIQKAFNYFRNAQGG
ncbi:MAG: hypothetical protein JWQ30_2209, partial [Sediminibacterium sp.]|nr:hypothetical protein [Sediminibacterium sp.]